MNQDTLAKLRNVQIDLLDEFVRICDEHKLTYFLAYGTLLGAVRHKGFIPWDDDVDIAMPRDDYEIFLDLFIEDNKETNYYVLSYKSRNKINKHCTYFAKFCKTGTVFAESYKLPENYSGIFIDILPFDNCIFFLTPLHTKIIKNVLNLYHQKVNVLTFTGKDKKKIFIGKILCCFLPEIFLENLHRKLCVIFNNFKTKYISFFSSGYGWKRETYKNKDIFPLSKVLFEGKYYNAPGNCDSYLKVLFGNYMELPPVEKRRTHTPRYIIFNEDEKKY